MCPQGLFIDRKMEGIVKQIVARWAKTKSRREIVGGLAAAVPALGLAAVGASPNFSLGDKCQHNAQCTSGCCRRDRCRRHRKCKHGRGQN